MPATAVAGISRIRHPGPEVFTNMGDRSLITRGPLCRKKGTAMRVALLLECMQ
ncbi:MULTISPECIES: hypothetical protein [Streptomyces]|uniref:Uncharacterized protein n=1 Tax=Streptomyces canarius TaxID=285453 RepID=A0ABQ3DB59_9ACTN|nr:hypothetical protein [Streptomyces canarius]GHA69618.1 hypothetical protein GCM10010345_86410 [Streptomyces canarius]